jgi:hypothetical protein
MVEVQIMYCTECGHHFTPDDDETDVCDDCQAEAFLFPEDLPGLNAEERMAMEALPEDFISRLLRGERPLGKPDWVED